MKKLSAEYPCSITGIPGQPVERIYLDQIHLETGGGMVSPPSGEVEERETAYPRGNMFGTLPCYGFFLRHVREITFREVTVRTLAPDARPPALAEDVTGLRAEGPGALCESLRRLAVEISGNQ